MWIKLHLDADRTPVLIAAERGRTSVVEILTEKFRASCLERTKDGSTLLHVASLHGHPETALMLLKKGVPLHMPNKVCFSQTWIVCLLEINETKLHNRVEPGAFT